ncbi:MAG: GNAT family N-acetyltransferase [Pseudomonadota bacterium]
MTQHTHTIRLAHGGDTVACAEIMAAWVNGTPWMPKLHTPGEDRAFCAGMIWTGGVTVAETGGEVTGFLGQSPNTIISLYVHSQMRGQGIGSALLNHAKGRAKTLTLWTFQANTGAQRFYLRHGFREVARTDGDTNDERLPDIEYRWDAA